MHTSGRLIIFTCFSLIQLNFELFLVSAGITNFGGDLRLLFNESRSLECGMVGGGRARRYWTYNVNDANIKEHDDTLTISDMKVPITNITCEVRNMYGSDKITYTLLLITTPTPPTIQSVAATSHSIQIQLSPTFDGGTPILSKLLLCLFTSRKTESSDKH